MATATANLEWVIRRGGMFCAVCGCEGQTVRVTLVGGTPEAAVCVDEALCAESKDWNEYYEMKQEEWAAQDRAEAGLGWE